MRGKAGLHLRISDPAVLLNNIAMRYQSTPSNFFARVIMEYIDNPLDAAETGFREHHGVYQRPVEIHVHLDSTSRSVEITDNTSGMNASELQRVVSNVGESSKRGLSWLNGQFGFGIHAFRAATKRMRIITKHSNDEMYELVVDRAQSTFESIRIVEGLPESIIGSRTGTKILLDGFDPAWFRGLTLRSIALEIERHFETLLQRKNLTVRVTHASGSQPVVEHVCQPFDYERLPGIRLKSIVPVVEHGKSFGNMNVEILVSEAPSPHRRVRFFQSGRQINFVGDVKSFMDVSVAKGSLWGHPQVLGFVDVSNLVEPVITRDEFKRSTSRVAVYKALCGLEKELRAALEKVSVEQRDKSMASLETVLRGVLARVANHDKKKQKKKETQVLEELAAAAPAPPPPDSITTDDIEYKVLAADRLQLEKALLTTEQDELTDKDAIALSASKAPRTGSTLSAPYDIRFVHAHADLEGRQRRSFVAGDCIFVNIDHPNFTDRVEFDQYQRPKLTDRLASYLASVVSVHYRDFYYEARGLEPPQSRQALYQELLDSLTDMEDGLRKRLPSLNRSLKLKLVE